MAKTMKQFTSEWMGYTDEYGNEVNRCFAFKTWFDIEDHKAGETVLVAVDYSFGRYHSMHAEWKNGGEFEMVCTGGNTKDDLFDAMCGC